MGSGDLNLLKSWNPKLMKNRKKVWEAEQELLREQTKLKQRQSEIAKERELNRLVKLSKERDRENGKGKGKDKGKDSTNSSSAAVKASLLAASGLEWMYDDQFSRNTLRDEYLLGKKKLDPTALKLSAEKQEDTPKETLDDTTTNDGTIDTVSASVKKKTYDYSRDDPMSLAQQHVKGVAVHLEKKRMVTKPSHKRVSSKIAASKSASANKFADIDY